MNFEPNKFFIGLTTFLSILLPGALIAYVLRHVPRQYFGIDIPAGNERWVMFAFGSYLAGHFVFLLGSGLLDDYVYEPIRGGTSARQIERLAKGEALSPRLIRFLARWSIQRGTDSSSRQAVEIKKHYLDPVGGSNAPNTFQWSIARLTLKYPEARAVVERFEADSKFFRSLFVVLFFVILWKFYNNQPRVALVGVPFLGLSLWRYVDQRIKAINHAYWFITTLEGEKEDGYRRPPHIETDENIRAGGVVFKSAGSEVQYLLVEAKDVPDEWVLPKGNIEYAESLQQAAVREVREETGAWGQIKRELPIVRLQTDNVDLELRFFLMEAVEQGRPAEKRAFKWLPLPDATKKASHPESVKILESAETARIALVGTEH